MFCFVTLQSFQKDSFPNAPPPTQIQQNYTMNWTNSPHIVHCYDTSAYTLICQINLDVGALKIGILMTMAATFSSGFQHHKYYLGECRIIVNRTYNKIVRFMVIYCSSTTGKGHLTVQ